MSVWTLIDQCKVSNGWQGAECTKCGATYNVAVQIPGIICERCGAFSVLSWSYHQPLHRKPDFGFNRSVIMWAMKHYSHYRMYFTNPI